MTEKVTEYFDVLIVGAGISGIGGAYHPTKQCSDTRFVVLETQESFGGTWLTHRYPGIRSDSDLYTFGYRFKPWTSEPIATAAEIGWIPTFGSSMGIGGVGHAELRQFYATHFIPKMPPTWR